MITFDARRRMFHIQTAEMSYLCSIGQDNRLVHRYWGSRLKDTEDLGELSQDWPVQDAGCSDHGYIPVPLEYRAQEPHTFDEPAVRVRFADGVTGARLVYKAHRLEENSLTITLAEETYPLEVELRYALYGDLPILSRSARFYNGGAGEIVLEKMASATVCLPDEPFWRLTHFAGRWGREYQRQETRLSQGKMVLENNRGLCAAHQLTPFFALDARGEATQTQGEVYYGALCWSGDFKITCERNDRGMLAVTAGVGETDTAWVLHERESFSTPQLLLGYSGRGFERMSETLYDLQYDYLCPRGKIDLERPVLYNSWYPYEFSLTEGNLLGLMERAAALGVELFVVDDGWMPGRTNDRAGLGDWVADPRRFPRGLSPLAERCHQLGMGFGLWIEPEMVNPDSALFREHPDWVLGETTRPRTLARNQYVLNFARDDVRDYAIACIDRLIDEYRLDYLKWDMNRYIGETGWPGAPAEKRAELRIRYIRNVYAVWEHMNRKYPHVLYENCAGGGGRTDFGMAAYADRINRSDNADPVDVLLLHEGFATLFLPKMAGGAGNISPSPNGMNGRVTPLDFRMKVGMMGSLSIGINLLQAPEGELEALKKCVAKFKRLRADLQNSYVYVIASLREGPYAVFQYVNRARTAFTVFAFGHGLHFRDAVPRLRLRGLRPEATYIRERDGLRARGDALMNGGIHVALHGDYEAVVDTYRMEETEN